MTATAAASKRSREWGTRACRQASIRAAHTWRNRFVARLRASGGAMRFAYNALLSRACGVVTGIRNLFGGERRTMTDMTHSLAHSSTDSFALKALLVLGLGATVALAPPTPAAAQTITEYAVPAAPLS